MAEPKKVKKSLFNSGAGPRTFYQADGTARTLRPGEEWTGELLDAEFKDLSADLKTPRPKAEARAPTPEGAGGGAGGSGGSDGPNAAELAVTIQNEAEALVKANEEDELRAIAEKEEVKGIEGDDNKNDIALKIVRKRHGLPEA
jgi:hypothetical protein